MLTAKNLDVLPEEDDAEAQRMEDAILAELRASPGDHTYILFASRVMGPTRQGFKEPHLFKGDAQQLLPEMYDRLRAVTKPGEIGDYRIRIHKDGQFWHKFDVSVEREPQAVTATQAPSEMTAILGALQRSNETVITTLQGLITRAPQVAAASVDPLVMMERAVTLIDKLRPSAPPAAESNAMALVEAFKSGIEMMANVGSENRESGYLDLIRDFIKSPIAERVLGAVTMPTMPVRPALTATPSATVRPPPAPATPQAAPANGNGQPTPPQPEGPATPDQIMAALNANPQLAMQVKQAVDYLVSRAQKNAETGFYADWIVDNWSPQFLALFLQNPDWFGFVMALNPEAARFQKWFEELFAELARMVNNSEGQDVASGDDAIGRRNPSIVPNGNPGWDGGSEGDPEMDGQPS